MAPPRTQENRTPRLLAIGALALVAAGPLWSLGTMNVAGLHLGETCRLTTFLTDLDTMWDYGDAPDTTEGPALAGHYPTQYVGGGSPDGFFPTLSDTVNAQVAGQPGARHMVVNVGWLGNASAYTSGKEIDPLALNDDEPSQERDADLMPDEDLSITNLDPTLLTPDHDGHDNGLYAAVLSSGAIDQLEFRVSSIDGVEEWFVNVLVDWNLDGRWAGTDANGAPEWAVVNFPVSVPIASSRLFAASVQTGSTIGEPWTRITLTPDTIQVADPAGWDGSVPLGTFDFWGRPAFACGETEDYCGRVVVKEAPELPPARGLDCGRAPVQEDDPCRENDLQSYTIDLSTGRANGVQANYYDQDDDWRATSPGQAGGPFPVFALRPLNVWAQPTIGQWVNPFGNHYWGKQPFVDYDNNRRNSPLGDYVYVRSFSVSPLATGVAFDFNWWRDDTTTLAHPFEYYDDAGGWTMLGVGGGFATASMTSTYFLDPTPNNSNAYNLRVTVRNDLTFTGLLVEGHATVYCGPLPIDWPEPNNPLPA